MVLMAWDAWHMKQLHWQPILLYLLFSTMLIIGRWLETGYLTATYYNVYRLLYYLLHMVVLELSHHKQHIVFYLQRELVILC